VNIDSLPSIGLPSYYGKSYLSINVGNYLSKTAERGMIVGKCSDRSFPKGVNTTTMVRC
jgi:hypothetical protein